MGKTKSPQERYKERKEREAAEQSSHLPPGLINHGNTCFMNSVLQGLNALPYLQQMIMMQFPPSARSPALTNGRGGEYEHEWSEGLKLSDTFLILMNKAWKIRELQQRTSMSPKELLSVIGQKYSQYNDFRQQDAHEFLRLLLDGMRMEEFDIIKKRQPPIPKSKKGKRKEASGTDTEMTPIPPEERLIPFVDATFTGQLASILVCQTCKHVSITREPFDDLSLSIKPEDVKRHRLRAFAHRLMGKDASDDSARPVSAPSSRPTTPFGGFGVLNASPRRRSLEKEVEAEAVDSPQHSKSPSASEQPKKYDPMDQIGAKIGRRVSLNWKSMKSEVRKVSKQVHESSGAPVEDRNEVLDIAAHPSNSLPPPSLPTGARPATPTEKKVQKRSARAHAAYVKSLLADHPFNKPLNPFSYLPSSSSWSKLAPEQGLEQCLRQFTSVEVLEKENMYGCRRCWKIANGYAVAPEDHDEEDEDEEADGGETKNTEHPQAISVDHSLPPSRLSPASMGFIETGQDMNMSVFDLASSTSSLPDPPRISTRPVPNRAMSIPVITTEPPPTPSTEPSDVGYTMETNNEIPPYKNAETSTMASNNSFLTPDTRIHHVRGRLGLDDDSLSGLSSDESSDEDLSDTSVTTASSQSSIAQAKAAAAREARARRAKEIIMRKAYKRYLIAKPPPVLVIHLKRFQQVAKSPSTFFGNLKKLDDYVPFPEYLDLSGYLAPRKRDFGFGSLDDSNKLQDAEALDEGRQEPCVYRLVSVVVHIGNMLGGHYIAYTALPPDDPEPTQDSSHEGVAHAPSSVVPSDPQSQPAQPAALPKLPSGPPPPRKWCYISDTVVRIVPFEEVIKSKAYICMYERIDVALGSETSAKL